MKDNPNDKIINLMKNTKPISAEKGHTISVDGSNNFVAGGDIIHINHVQKNIVRPDPQGTLSPAQKSELKERIKEWVVGHNAVKAKELSFQGAWSRFNRAQKVNSYHEIKAEDYERALKWISNQIGKLLSMASAPKKDTEFRKKAYRTIHARCNQLGDKDLYKPYIEKNFGSFSLKDLSEDELASTRKWILGKKP